MDSVTRPRCYSFVADAATIYPLLVPLYWAFSLFPILIPTIPERLFMLVCLRRSVSLLLLIALSITAYAQSDDNSNQTDAPTGGLCGTDLMGQIDRNVAITNTARLNPALYQKMVAASKQ